MALIKKNIYLLIPILLLIYKLAINIEYINRDAVVYLNLEALIKHYSSLILLIKHHGYSLQSHIIYFLGNFTIDEKILINKIGNLII